MRIVFFLLSGVCAGLAALSTIGVLGTSRPEGGRPREIWVVIAMLIVVAVAALIGGIRRYQGGWPFLIGLAHFQFASFLPYVLRTRPASSEGSLVLLGGSLCAGVLLLYSGHKLHKLSAAAKYDVFE